MPPKKKPEPLVQNFAVRVSIHGTYEITVAAKTDKEAVSLVEQDPGSWEKEAVWEKVAVHYATKITQG